ncbi:HTH araC/xylS-type domain-containing protein [Tenacibaculum sp. 190130A14a]|uniref:HTH araC/xylS-type domain-containing protein n=1 Tax=Tenacibaculum polynesiense TaxID=3137857 RepID=A0ABP1F3G8_9FLAO
MNTILYIKNMVCPRCIKVITDELTKNQINFDEVNLGSIHFKETVDETTLHQIKQILKKEGFELLKNKDRQLINKIKSILIEQIHHSNTKVTQNISTILTDAIGMDYTNLSKLFSETERTTIEKYIIHLKIEKVKELLKYGELNLSQISYDLNYSSPQHLSRQFKQVTGLTPTQFKAFGKRNTLDKLNNDNGL